jgi:hypothetical protein
VKTVVDQQDDERARAILNAIIAKKMNQMSTQEIAEQFQWTTEKTRKLLTDLTTGKMRDTNDLVYVPEESGVRLPDDTIFTGTLHDYQQDGQIGKKTVKQYIWFYC